MRFRKILVAGAALTALGTASIMYLNLTREGASQPGTDSGVTDDRAARLVHDAAARAGEAVLAQLHEARWSAWDAAAIAHAVEVALPVSAGVGTPDYLSFIESNGLPGDPARTRERFEIKAATGRWKELTEAGFIPALPEGRLSVGEMHRLLVEAGPLLHDARVRTIDPDSVTIRESTNVDLAEGERYTMTSALSAAWTPTPGLSPGVSVEVDAVLTDGRAIRIHLLIAQAAGRDGPVWAPAACALVSSEAGRLPFVTY